MSKPRLLDGFCKAGGATRGYQQAGLYVVGVDREPQPNYVGDEFVEADFFDLPLDWLKQFDAIHASPPCQAFTMRTMGNARPHDDLLTPTRERLKAAGLPYVIENVPGSPIDVRPIDLFGEGGGIMLCGSMFGLRTEQYELRRHRWFESSVPLPQFECRHSTRTVVGFYGDHARTNGARRGGDITGDKRKMPLVRDLLGIDWMAWEEATQAIPPAYTSFIGERLLASIKAAA